MYNTKAQRYGDALAIVDGQQNPIDIVNSLAAAVEELHYDEGADMPAIKNDPAVRLMVHQLANLCRVIGGGSDWIGFGLAWEACQNAVSNQAIADAPLGIGAFDVA